MTNTMEVIVERERGVRKMIEIISGVGEGRNFVKKSGVRKKPRFLENCLIKRVNRGEIFELFLLLCQPLHIS